MCACQIISLKIQPCHVTSHLLMSKKISKKMQTNQYEAKTTHTRWLSKIYKKPRSSLSFYLLFLSFDRNQPLTQKLNLSCFNAFILNTILQSMKNVKLSPHRFWPCHEDGLIKTIQMIPHNIYVSFKLASLYCGLRLILVYPNP